MVLRYLGVPSNLGATCTELLRCTLEYPGTDTGAYALARYRGGVLTVYWYPMLLL